MKTYWLSLVMLVMSSHAWSQAGELYNAGVTFDAAVTDPAQAIGAADGQWLAFSLPVLTGTHSPCCWKGRWSVMGESGCSLEKRHQSYGTRSDSPLAENVIVFSRIRDGRVHDLRVVGEECPVDAGGAQVTWVGNVKDDAALDWLENAAQSGRTDLVSGTALMAMALHRSPAAGQHLYSLAKTPGGELSGEAIFWLGETRGGEGFRILKQLLAELPKGEARREINFALAQNDSLEASELLLEIGRSDSDPEQRGEAMFWLAEAYPQQAQGWLLELIETEKDEGVLEQAVFAISQLPGESGDRTLLKLAQDPDASRTVRRQAIFWLAQSDDDSSVAALTELLTR